MQPLRSLTNGTYVNRVTIICPCIVRLLPAQYSCIASTRLLYRISLNLPTSKNFQHPRFLNTTLHTVQFSSVTENKHRMKSNHDLYTATPPNAYSLDFIHGSPPFYHALVLVFHTLSCINLKSVLYKSLWTDSLMCMYS